jgi:hypothetical protein
MTRHERVAAEIRVAFDLVRHFVKNPAVLREIPAGATVEVISRDREPGRLTPDGGTVTFVANRVFKRLRNAA